MRLKAFVTVLFFLFIGKVMAQELIIPDDKKIIQFESKIGNITFAHEKHAGLSITRCTTCHHKIQPADSVVKPCHECHHHESIEPPKAKIAFHTRCTGCHQYTTAEGQAAGPLVKKCKLCHIK